MQSPPSADAVVRPTRRQVEHVAGLEHVLLLGAKRRRILSGTSRRSAESKRRADSPAPASVRLEQEHVVAVDVRSDAAAVAGV